MRRQRAIGHARRRRAGREVCMTFFNIGPLEIIIILVAALVIFGPDRLPQVARQVGGWIRDFRRWTSSMTAEFEAISQEFSSEFGELRAATEELQAELRGMQRDLSSVQSDLRRELTGGEAETGDMTAGSIGSTEGAAATQTSATAGYGAASVTEGAVHTNGHGQPAASKDDPRADVSFFDLDELVVMPRTPRPMNGHPPQQEAPPAQPRAARLERRPPAGYRRPRVR
jgi:sec-independent protein translocase protein TatB